MKSLNLIKILPKTDQPLTPIDTSMSLLWICWIQYTPDGILTRMLLYYGLHYVQRYLLCVGPRQLQDLEQPSKSKKLYKINFK